MKICLNCQKLRRRLHFLLVLVEENLKLRAKMDELTNGKPEKPEPALKIIPGGKQPEPAKENGKSTT